MTAIASLIVKGNRRLIAGDLFSSGRVSPGSFTLAAGRGDHSRWPCAPRGIFAFG
jgi:hypothetical protein